MTKDTLRQSHSQLLDNSIILCGQGWLGLIDALCNSIELHIKNSSTKFKANVSYNKMVETARQGDWKLFDQYYLNWLPSDLDKRRREIVSENLREIKIPCPDVVIKRIEVKAGTLEVDWTGGDDTVTGMIELAKIISRSTCEKCGAPGTIRGKGWIYTSCENHANQPNLKFYEEDECQGTL